MPGRRTIGSDRPARAPEASGPATRAPHVRADAVLTRPGDAAPHTEEAGPLTTFRELGVLSETAEALEALGIIEAFPVQEMTLPVALSGSDVIGQAKTGTGKTLGFGIPLLQRVTVAADIESGRAPAGATAGTKPQALVVVPTRELCVQVTNDLQAAGKMRNVRVLAIYGGRAYEPQVDTLRKGVDVVVGTPGRLLDLAGQGHLNLSEVKVLVLDEADEMLDLGFLPDVEKIIDRIPPRRQTMLFSATMPGQIITLARRYMNRPTHIRASAPDDQGATVASVSQHVYRAHALDKQEMLARILQAEGRGLAMVFCRTKRTAADLAEGLTERGFAAAAVHGDLGQGAREQALRAFRNGKVDVLVATDVAARGIDVDGVTHVVNYQCPEDEKTYLHRIGRTGRAGASGTAVTLVDWEDIPRWALINKALELPFPDPAETYSTSAHLFSDLNIPAGTGSVLPRASRSRAGLEAETVEDLGETRGRGRSRGAGGRGRPKGRDEQAEESTPSRRRAPGSRRRRRLNDGTAPAGDAVQTAETPAATESAPASKRNRRRTRRSNADAVVETVAEAAVVTPEVAEPAPKRTRTRTRGGAVETPAAVESPETAEVAEAAPKRTRMRTRSAAAQSAVETVAEAAVVTPEVAEPAPRRTRKKAVAAEPVAAVTEVVEVAEVAPKKATRTRKKVADAAVVTPEVAEAAPKRTRKKAVAAEPVAAVAEVAEVAPKKATRTRKKAVAEPVAEAAEAVAETAAPKRARKKAEVAPSEAPAEKPKVTRTRKKAAAPVEAAE